MWRDMFRANYADSGPLAGSGVSPDPGLTVQATGPASASVDVTAGSALVHGAWYNNNATKNLTIAANASGNPRVDSIILRKDWTLQTIRLAVKQGTPAVSPTPPGLTQSAGTMWEEAIADVAVANAFVTIANADITPRRMWANAADGIYLNDVLNNSGVTLITGDVVIWDTTANRAVTTTTTEGNNNIAGVWVGRTINGGYGRVLTKGIGYINVDGAVATRGLALINSTTAKKAKTVATTATLSRLNAIGISLETTSGAGLCLALIDIRTHKNVAHQVINSLSGFSTTSASFVDIDASLTLTINTNTGRVKVEAHWAINSDTTSVAAAYFDWILDSTTRAGDATQGLISLPFNSNSEQSMVAVFTGLSNGSHTFKPQFKSGTAGKTINVKAWGITLMATEF